MDPKITTWILEYLLRQPTIPDTVMTTLLTTLPTTNPTPLRLNKTQLLRNIHSHISSGSFSEPLLDHLQHYANLYKDESNPVSPLLKEAYCYVAVDCTARYLSGVGVDGGKYGEAVERVWRERVWMNEDLCGDDTWRCWKEIQEAGRDAQVCDRVLGRNTRNDGVVAVRRFLEDEWARLGPPVLEVFAVRVPDGEVAGVRDGCDEGRGVASEKGIKTRKTIVRRKHVAVKKGAKISDADDIDPVPDKVQEKDNATCDSHLHPDASQGGVHNLPCTTINDDSNNVGVNNAVENHVTDPLPEDLNIAGTHVGPEVGPVQPKTNSVKSIGIDPEMDAENQSGSNIHVNPEVGPVQPETDSGGFTENNTEKVKKKGLESHESRERANRKSSLMEPNGTSHTLQWDDSDDNLSGSGRVSLPRSSKKAKVEPLSPNAEKKISRRERRKWTPQEEETLRDAVKKFGRRWKFILGCYPEAFVDRSDVDLKDKWRNMVK